MTKLPTTLAFLRVFGVRLRVTCSAACSATGSLSLNGRSIGRKTVRLTKAGTQMFSVKPSALGRVRLRGRSRARLKISGSVAPVGGTVKRASRTFTVGR